MLKDSLVSPNPICKRNAFQKKINDANERILLEATLVGDTRSAEEFFNTIGQPQTLISGHGTTRSITCLYEGWAAPRSGLFVLSRRQSRMNHGLPHKDDN